MFTPSTRNSNPPANRLKHVLLLACFLCTLSWLALCVLNGGIQMRPFLPPRPKSVIEMNNSSFAISTLDMGISDEEWERLQKALDWPGPDQEITQLDLSTSPVHSTFSIVELKKSYKVGDNISVIITARDHNKNLKTYGGDFFKAKLFNSKLKVRHKFLYVLSTPVRLCRFLKNTGSLHSHEATIMATLKGQDPRTPRSVK
ncbi:NXPE family member 4-like [Cyprinus carpio]|uniref:NXPE family member 4-like n=1 Tax=Cyprinus carpio TaxID=7962 RepID=A0A9R0ARP5_CYPCA|nr:NXPE family member 4-like [Cyprinus carpio]